MTGENTPSYDVLIIESIICRCATIQCDAVLCVMLYIEFLLISYCLYSHTDPAIL